MDARELARFYVATAENPDDLAETAENVWKPLKYGLLRGDKGTTS